PPSEPTYGRGRMHWHARSLGAGLREARGTEARNGWLGNLKLGSFRSRFSQSTWHLFLRAKDRAFFPLRCQTLESRQVFPSAQPPCSCKSETALLRSEISVLTTPSTLTGTIRPHTHHFSRAPRPLSDFPNSQTRGFRSRPQSPISTRKHSAV